MILRNLDPPYMNNPGLSGFRHLRPDNVSNFQPTIGHLRPRRHILAGLFSRFQVQLRSCLETGRLLVNSVLLDSQRRTFSGRLRLRTLRICELPWDGAGSRACELCEFANFLTVGAGMACEFREFAKSSSWGWPLVAAPWLAAVRPT